MGIIKSIKFRDKLYMTLKMLEPDTQEYAHVLTNLRTYNRILKCCIRTAKHSTTNNFFTNTSNISNKPGAQSILFLTNQEKHIDWSQAQYEKGGGLLSGRASERKSEPK